MQMLLVQLSKADIKTKAEVLGICECGAPAQIAFLGKLKFVCLECEVANEARTKAAKDS
jgi:hypothetical protein